MQKPNMNLMNRILPWSVIALLFATTPLAFGQEGGASQDVKFYEIFFKGDAKMVAMWLLVIMSVVMVTFTIELFIKLRISKLAPPAVVALIRDALAAGNYQLAWETCRANPCYLSRVIAAGLERVGRGREVTENAVAEVSAKEASDLKSHNNYLSVIGVVAPMVGLTGTVLGMMEAFAVLGQGGVANMTGLSSAISAVLIATAAGLIVAIPAFILFYFFKNQATDVIVAANSQVNLLLEDIPFEQLTGLRVGQHYAEGAVAGGYANPAAAGAAYPTYQG
ncbi:MAG: MotA/TolQ/ExbB proton channel family protein [Verrucomicrobiia bacterium]